MVTPSVLVVEDEGITALAIQNTLKGFGYKIGGVASSGEEALQKVDTISPDLVLMDIHLRGKIDGIQAATKLRRDYDIPVIYLSAYTDPETVQSANQAEPYGYLAKPFSERELFTTIETTMYRHHLDKTLREREQWYASLFQSLLEGVIATDSSGHITFINELGETLTGLRQPEIIGRDFLEILPQLGLTDPETNQEMMTHLFQSGQPFGPVIRQITNTPQGIPYWLEIQIFPIQADSPTVMGASVIFRDITNRKQAEQELRESEERFSQFMDHLPGLAHIKDGHHRMMYLNKAFEDTFGISCEAWLGKPVDDILPPASVEQQIQNDQWVFNNDKALQVVEDFEHEDGLHHYLTCKFPIHRVDAPPLLGALSIDITKQRNAEKALAETFQRLRQLSHRLNNAEEEERKRVARELHDEFGHLLTALKLDLTWLRESLPSHVSSSSEIFLKKIESMMAVIDSIIHAVRDITAFLRPTFLDQLGLVKALQELGESLESQTSMICHIDVAPDLPIHEFDETQSTTIYRMTQELLTNIKKHAKATQAKVSLSIKDQTINLIVTDDGKGLGTEEEKSKRSFGLKGIEERAWLLGGTFTIQDSSQGGTTAVVQLPLDSFSLPHESPEISPTDQDKAS